MRLLRTESERLERLLAGGGVSGSWPVAGAGAAHWSAGELEVEWDDRQELERLLLHGEALLRTGAQTLRASRIELTRATPGWQLSASGGVRVEGPIMGSQAGLSAELLLATTDAAWALREAHASGTIVYEGGETRAQAARAEFRYAEQASGGGQIELFAGEQGKARLAHGRTRVAAQWIRTDGDGQRLEAQGQVEATLLPAARPSAQPSAQGLFLADSAVHFLSQTLQSAQGGTQLTFSGAVRGWQGQRSLAADWVALDQEHDRIEARQSVATRIPRDRSAGAAVEGDYVQIHAASLRYDDALGRADYEGQARLVLAEGWLEAQRLEIVLAPETRRVQEVRAQEGVRLEFRSASEPSPILGSSDRALYLPAENTLQLFGDRTPAQVRRESDQGGQTSGRRLLYRLDLGTLEVDSGPHGPARIATRSQPG
jgi:lipopolysaccharide export system protein LptA